MIFKINKKFIGILKKRKMSMKMYIFLTLFALISITYSINISRFTKKNVHKKILNERSKKHSEIMKHAAFNSQVLSKIKTITDVTGTEWKCYKKINVCVKKFKTIN